MSPEIKIWTYFLFGLKYLFDEEICYIINASEFLHPNNSMTYLSFHKVSDHSTPHGGVANKKVIIGLQY